MPLCVLTGKLEVGPGGVYRCRGGGSSQSGRQKNSYSSKCQAGTYTCNRLGTAVTSHTHQPADLERRRVKRMRLILFFIFIFGKKWKQSQYFLTSLPGLQHSLPSLFQYGVPTNGWKSLKMGHKCINCFQKEMQCPITAGHCSFLVKAIFSCRLIQFWCTGEYSQQQDCISGIDLK